MNASAITIRLLPKFQFAACRSQFVEAATITSTGWLTLLMKYAYCVTTTKREKAITGTTAM
jgi:hypothetical protein